MKVYGSIFLLVKHQGDYDEYSADNICAIKTKALANHFVHRYEVAYNTLLDFYRDKVYEIEDIHGKNYAEYPIDIFNEWVIFCDKRNKYYGARFDVQEVKLRRF